MSQSEQQKLYQAKGIIQLSESFLDRQALTTTEEIEFLQQALAAAAALLSEVLEQA